MSRGRVALCAAVALGRVVVIAPAAGLGTASCGGNTWGVSQYPHPPFAPATAVGFPPPPAQVEHLSDEAPAPGCRWVDGQWTWAPGRWEWTDGRWIEPPDTCRYSAPTSHWVSSEGRSVLYYRPGRWYSVSEPRICPEPQACPGAERIDPTAPPKF